MQTLQINKSDALTAYNKGSQSEKNFLENLFGKQTFSQKITDRIKTMDDVYAAQGTSSFEFVSKCFNAGLSDDEVAYRQAKMIADTLNEGTKIDVADINQWKYYPWFKVNPDPKAVSGFGLSYGGCGDSYSVAYRGARLAFKSEELAIYAGKTFTKIYEALYA